VIEHKWLVTVGIGKREYYAKLFADRKVCSTAPGGCD